MNNKFFLYKVKGDCCGCSACASICPADAIEMKPDEEGFDYPFINENKCISCFRCIHVCPLRRNDK